MSAVSLRDIELLMILGVFLLGAASFITGVIILVTRTMSSELRNIENQTTRLAQKGLAEEVSGLVGNASNLLTALKELVNTGRGIGIFLILTGVTLMSIALLFIQKFSEMNL